MAHDRTLDHYGTEDTTTTVLATQIGQYPAGTTLHDVLVSMVARLDFIESVGDTTRVGYLLADAIILKTISSTLTADAFLVGFIGSFTADAFIQPSFTADAFIVADPTCP